MLTGDHAKFETIFGSDKSREVAVPWELQFILISADTDRHTSKHPFQGGVIPQMNRRFKQDYG